MVSLTKLNQHVIIITIIFNLLRKTNGSLKDILDNVESDVNQLAQILYNDLPNRCNRKMNMNCSYLSCSNIRSDLLQCNNDFKINDCKIPDCDPVGHLLNAEQFTVRLANEKEGEKVIVNQAVKEIVNGSYELHAKFKEIFYKTPNIYKPKWMYFGSYNGIQMSYPGKEICSPFDNRYRPWYIGAITGVKNLIFVIDVSGQIIVDMSVKDVLVSMINIILKSLLYSDRVGFITYNNSAKSYYPTLITATEDNIKNIKNIIDKLEFTGQSNLEDAFQKLNDLIKNTSDAGFLIPCKTNVMLFSYGTPTVGIVDKTQLTNLIKNLVYLKNIRIYAYTFSVNNISNELACSKNGAYEYVDVKDNPYTKLNSYFTLISLNSNVTNPLWVDVYSDSNGLGLMTTCAIPVYDTSVYNAINHPYNRIYGVVAIDILVADLLKFENLDEINKELRKRSLKACSNENLEPSECQLNSIRTNKCDIADNSCKGIDYLIPICDSDNLILSEIFCNKENYLLTQKDIDNCCFNSCKYKGSLIGGILGFVAVITIISVLVWYFSCRNNGNKDVRDDKEEGKQVIQANVIENKDIEENGENLKTNKINTIKQELHNDKIIDTNLFPLKSNSDKLDDEIINNNADDINSLEKAKINSTGQISQIGQIIKIVQTGQTGQIPIDSPNNVDSKKKKKKLKEVKNTQEAGTIMPIYTFDLDKYNYNDDKI